MTEPDKLYMLWTSGDPTTAEKMVLMYAANSRIKDWWSEVTVIIWGAAASLIARDANLQERLKAAQIAGVHFSASKACADQVGITYLL